MTWIGKTEWLPPGEVTGVREIHPQWIDDGRFVVFFIGQDLARFEPGGYVSALWAQKATVSDAGVFAFEPPERLATYSSACTIDHIERVPGGDFAVFVQPGDSA